MAYPTGTYIDGDKIISGDVPGEADLTAVMTVGGKQFSCTVSLSVVEGHQPSIYPGPYSVQAANSAQTLHTQGKLMTQNISVSALSYNAEPNASGGETVTIGG